MQLSLENEAVMQSPISLLLLGLLVAMAFGQDDRLVNGLFMRIQYDILNRNGNAIEEIHNVQFWSVINESSFV